MESEFWGFVRENVTGRDAVIETPFGQRPLLYADHTASGRSVRFVEDYLCSLFPFYGNTHTDDDFTGNFSTRILQIAMEKIKKMVNASDHHKLILVGSGATGAIERLQAILGVYLPPATRARLVEPTGQSDASPEGGPTGQSDASPEGGPTAGQSGGPTGGGPAAGVPGPDDRFPVERMPVVFVGPYEHHSNEVTWRECFAEVVEIGLTAEGLIDLADLEAKLDLPAYQGRKKIGSFSAASNVSGVRSDVYAIARILHRHGALACFDFAALAPYARIDVNHDAESYFDAVFFSPHKFLGGPGSSGVLVIHDRVYRTDLAPSHGGGGTVDYVSQTAQHYLADIEGREMAGTPGIPQAWKVALAMELKEKMGIDAIEEREREIVLRVYSRIAAHPNIEIIGNAAPENRIGILSFLVRIGKHYLHPRFVARLLNDLFGIQSRGGCSCAGPYGHRVLSIGGESSEQYRKLILAGKCGVKPGWTRVTLHFLLRDEELDFLCDAVLFVAEEGRYFLPLYTFDLYSGSWKHVAWAQENPRFGLDEALDRTRRADHLPSGIELDVADEARLSAMRSASLAEARRIASELRSRYSDADVRTLAESPFPFEYYDEAPDVRASI